MTAPSSAGEVAATSAGIAELSRAGKYSEATVLAQRRLESLEKTRGPFDRDVAGALNNLALLYSDQGHDAEAEPMYKRAVAILDKAGGLDASGGAPELNNLAALYQRQERYADAEPLFKRARALRERSLYPAFRAPFALIGEGRPTSRLCAATALQPAAGGLLRWKPAAGSGKCRRVSGFLSRINHLPGINQI